MTSITSEEVNYLVFRYLQEAGTSARVPAGHPHPLTRWLRALRLL